MGPSLRVLQTIRQTGGDGPVWDRPLRKERNRFDICRRGGAEGELPRRGKRSHPGVCPSRHSPKSAVGATLAVARNAGRRGRRPLHGCRRVRRRRRPYPRPCPGRKCYHTGVRSMKFAFIIEIFLSLWGIFGLYVAFASVLSLNDVILLLVGGSMALFSFALAAGLELLRKMRS